MQDLFEKASRGKFRFKTNVGVLSSEDLWDLPLSSLDALAKSLNKEVKESEEESFIKPKNTVNMKLINMFDLVKYVIGVRLQEDEDRKAALANKKKREKIMELIEQKEGENLSSKSIEELRAELLTI